MILKAQLGDITKIPVDAIVHSVQSSRGVDGVILEAAGTELGEEYLNNLPTFLYVEGGEYTGCPIAEVVVTKAYRLPAKYVLHTVGQSWKPQYVDRTGRSLAPHWDAGLSLCYKHCLAKAVELQAKSISFPLVGRAYPLEREARIAVLTALYVPGPDDMEVIFVCPDQKALDVYSYVLSKGRSLIDKSTGAVLGL